jgi:cell division initiation protein
MPDQSSAATEHAIIQEITRPLEHLPDDPLEMVNAEFPTALRGYDRVAVDAYVRQTRQLVAELQATRSPEAAVRRALERVGEQISGILQRAHETAESITAQSRREAEDRLEQAREEAGQIIRAAEQRVRDLDADTDRIWLERQRIVADAEDLAAQLHSVARTAAERFPDDVEIGGQEDDGEAFADDGEEVAPPDPPGLEPVHDPAAEASPQPAAPVPFDGETTAETVERPMYGVDAQEEADFFGESDAPQRERSEVEQTMAFRPLTSDGGGGLASDAPASDPPASVGPADEREERLAGDERAGSAAGDPPPGEAEPDGFDPDATQIIPPSSQAAHQRHEH